MTTSFEIARMGDDSSSGGPSTPAMRRAASFEIPDGIAEAFDDDNSNGIGSAPSPTDNNGGGGNSNLANAARSDSTEHQGAPTTTTAQSYDTMPVSHLPSSVSDNVATGESAARLLQTPAAGVSVGETSQCGSISVAFQESALVSRSFQRRRTPPAAVAAANVKIVRRVTNETDEHAPSNDNTDSTSANDCQQERRLFSESGSAPGSERIRSSSKGKSKRSYHDEVSRYFSEY